MCRQKLEQGRARFRRIVAAAASAGQSLRTLKELLEDTAREWPSSPAAVAAPDFSANHCPERATRPVSDRATSAGSSDGPLKLSSGERRILIALAQHPQGRSKVQVAVLTGYAAAGGGFNNYLGALRSHGLIQGDGDRLTITDAGIEAPGTWGATAHWSRPCQLLVQSVGKGGAFDSGGAHAGLSQYFE